MFIINPTQQVFHLYYFVFTLSPFSFLIFGSKSSKLKKILFISLFISNQLYSQTTSVSAENTWLIDYYFKSDKSTQQHLSNIYTQTIAAKYDGAKSEIALLKKRLSKKNIAYAATLCYEANIFYNESSYAYSIRLADSAVDILQHKSPNNRYVVKALNIQAKGKSALNELRKAEKIIRKALAKAINIKDQHGVASSYYCLGSVYSDRGFYLKSKKYFSKSVSIRKKIKDELGLAASYSFLGLTYAQLGDYALGVEYIQRSIKLREKTKDKRGLANSYLSLYKIYIGIGESDKALESELKSLSICNEINDLQCVSGRLTNLGEIYQNKGDFKKALRYHYLALGISKKINIKNRVAEVHENIAQNFNSTKKYEAALLHIDSCKRLRKAIGDEEGLASATLVLAQINFNQLNIVSAIENGNSALSNSNRLKLPYLIKDAHQVLSNAYSQNGNSDKSLFHYKQYIVWRDSLYSIDKSKEIVRKELEFSFDKKEEVQQLKAAKKLEETNAESRKQRLIIVLIIIALIVLSSILLFAIWQYRLKIKSEKKLHDLNADLNTKNDLLENKSMIIENQSATIQEKSKEITDSIRYAQKIQTAIMPLKDEFAAYFNDSFVLFEPKDIISGDFFWITRKHDKIIYATVDCTGHGVPGGFMSMLGVSLLNEIVNEHDLTEPSLILSRLRKKVITALRQKGLSGEQQDGMDMTICVIDKKEMTLQYAAANHVFYVIRKKEAGFELEEYHGDKQPVGIYGRELKPFTQQCIDLFPNDVIYTFTDGYADQFGGPKDKKFMYKQLKELLLSIQELDLVEQEDILKDRFTAWKGNLEQIDDVCIIGVRI